MTTTNAGEASPDGVRIPGPGEDVFASTSKLQSVYDQHAPAFGMMENNNAANLRKFGETVLAHVRSAETRAVQGLYRGDPSTFYVKPNGLTVITKPSGELVTGFQLDNDQLKNLFTRGKVN